MITFLGDYFLLLVTEPEIFMLSDHNILCSKVIYDIVVPESILPAPQAKFLRN